VHTAYCISGREEGVTYFILKFVLPTLKKMEREIFFLGNLFPKYEELVPYYEVNYFFPFLQGKLTLM